MDFLLCLSMYPYQDWFSTYESTHGRVFMMGYNAQYRFVCTRTIKIKTHGGIVISIYNIWHILELKKKSHFISYS